MITLSYVPVDFKIRFENGVEPKRNPNLAFALRSVLGYNLRSMSCIAHKTTCPDCQYKGTCAYSYIFETIVSPENDIHTGTNRASHPYAFTHFDYTAIQKDCNYSEASFSMALLGHAIDFLPYIYASFYKAGKTGLFKERIKYEILDVSICGNSILIDENNLQMDFKRQQWKYLTRQDSNKHEHRQILVELKSPMRFKAHGKYTIDFSEKDFMGALFRRLKTCCLLYGTFSDDFLAGNKYLLSESVTIKDKKLQWYDSTHYSARQKKAMELGGILGSFMMQGDFSDFDLALLDFAKKFNAGKNTNFGLGQIDFWERNA